MPLSPNQLQWLKGPDTLIGRAWETSLRGERISPIHTKMLFPEGAETNAVGRHSQDQNRSLHPELSAAFDHTHPPLQIPPTSKLPKIRPGEDTWSPSLLNPNLCSLPFSFFKKPFIVSFLFSIYLFILAALGLCCFVRAFSRCREQELLCSCAWTYCGGVSGCGAQAQGARASVVAVRGL